MAVVTEKLFQHDFGRDNLGMDLRPCDRNYGQICSWISANFFLNLAEQIYERPISPLLSLLIILAQVQGWFGLIQIGRLKEVKIGRLFVKWWYLYYLFENISWLFVKWWNWSIYKNQIATFLYCYIMDIIL